MRYELIIVDKSTIDYKSFDKECVELCKTLNAMDGVRTTESCCGHLHFRYIVFLRCDNFSTLAKIARSVDRNYSDGKWELLVDSGDQETCCRFWLRSKDAFKSEDDMNKSVSALIENLIYWQDPKFSDYFTCNK